MSNNQITIEELVKRCTRKAIKLAQKTAPGIDPEDAVQTFALAAVEVVGSYNPDDPRCASLETFALSCYQNYLKREAAQARYGVELDGQEEGSEFVPLTDHLEALSSSDEQDGEDANGNRTWRNRSDADAQRRLAMLPIKLRNFANEILSGKSVAEAAAAGRTCDRNGRYQVEKIIELMNRNPNFEQGQIFS